MQMRSLRERIKELQASHVAQISVVVDKFHQLKRQITEYHQTLDSAMALEPTAAVRAATLR